MIQAMIHDEGNEDTTAAEAVKGTIHEAFEDTKAADVVITIHNGNEETTAAKVVKGNKNTLNNSSLFITLISLKLLVTNRMTHLKKSDHLQT